MSSGPEVSELLALRMASYTTLGVNLTLIEVYWGLLAGKETTIEDGAVNKNRNKH